MEGGRWVFGGKEGFRFEIGIGIGIEIRVEIGIGVEIRIGICTTGREVQCICTVVE